ncbi:hypothetical protein [Geothrix alkalitolerans]|uniref:hypothetical protein n=1 Tax=Geothrix alkalitolerans TaxID=2922724 RepID=UPI001FAF1D2E|nr:hypothetical protein [Geothrix alkalitolerans]
MIHHISIPARDPEHVAKVLAELIGGHTGGYAGPFVGPIPGAWVAYAEDAHGTGIEVYPERTTLVPGEAGSMGAVALRQAPAAVAFHALISVKAGRTDIERIGAREGWRTLHFWRGPNPQTQLFELYEFWVENRVMLELATEDMVEAYRKLAQGPAQRDLLARLGGGRP